MATRVILKKGRERRLRAGHLWVYQGEVEKIEGSWDAEGPTAGPGLGDIVDVVDSTGRFMGRGFISPTSSILVRILTRDPAEAIDGAFLRRRIERALAYRKKVAPGVEAFRVVFGEADLLPGLIVDKYKDLVVIQTLTRGMDARKETITTIIRDLLGTKWIYERNDVASRKLEGLPLIRGFLVGRGDGGTAAGDVPRHGTASDNMPDHGAVGLGAGGPGEHREDPETRFEIVENGLRFLVDVEMGQKTGSFLDQLPLP